jgi:hypothetical protein
MPKVNIDNNEYHLDKLSDECTAQLASLQFVKQELSCLQVQLAVLQTARFSHSKALQAALQVAGGSDTIKLS